MTCPRPPDEWTAAQNTETHSDQAQCWELVTMPTLGWPQRPPDRWAAGHQPGPGHLSTPLVLREDGRAEALDTLTSPAPCMLRQHIQEAGTPSRWGTYHTACPYLPSTPPPPLRHCRLCLRLCFMTLMQLIYKVPRLGGRRSTTLDIH